MASTNAMSNDNNSFTCSICLQDMIPRGQNDFEILAQEWVESPELVEMLDELENILKKNASAQDYLTKLTWEMLDNKLEDRSEIVQKRALYSDVDIIIRNLVVERLECHSSSMPQFHVGCLKKVILENKPCPMCRQDFDQTVRENFGLLLDDANHKRKSWIVLIVVGVILTGLFLTHDQLWSFINSTPAFRLLQLSLVFLPAVLCTMRFQPPGRTLHEVEAWLDGEDMLDGQSPTREENEARSNFDFDDDIDI